MNAPDADLPLARQLRDTFTDLTRQRDTPVESTTEERYIPTEDGYIHEVTSRTTPRRRPDTGEDVQTVTRRRVSASAVEHQPVIGSLNLQYSHKQLPPHQTTSPGSALRLDPLNTGTHMGGGGGTYAMTQSTSRSGSSSVPAGPDDHWRYVESQPAFHKQPDYSQRNLDAMAPPSQQQPHHHRRTSSGGGGGGVGGFASTGSASKNVGFGSVQTVVVEPSRISPLHGVGANYAPLKYVTRRELREMQRQRQRGLQGQQGLQQRIRHSSVPRLDSMRMDSDSPARREFWDPDGLDDANPQNPQQQQQAYYTNHRSASQVSARSSGFNGGAQRAFGSPPTAGYYAGGGGGGGGGRSSSARSTGSGHGRIAAYPSIDRYVPMPNVDGEEMLVQFAESLARIRGIQHIHDVPAYGGAAMRLLLRGTYLIHYGKNPHERFFALRMIADDWGRMQPYLVWSIHADSATYTERLHLAHLAGMGRGTDSYRFRKYQIDGRHMRGPFVGDEPSLVPTTFAFSFVFQSRQSTRSVDALALDDQTFRCWLLVMDYLADVNAGGAEVEYEAETLAPDTPRSSVAPSAAPSEMGQ